MIPQRTLLAALRSPWATLSLATLVLTGGTLSAQVPVESQDPPAKTAPPPATKTTPPAAAKQDADPGATQTDQGPGSTKPAEDKSAEDKSAEDKSAEGKPAEDKPAGPAIPTPPPAPVLHGWAQELERAGTRMVFYRESPPGQWNASPGQIAITYSKAKWGDTYKDSIEALLDPKTKAPDVQRWRLGKNLWTTLDARLPLTIGGTSISPGYYYLALEIDRRKDEPFQLCVLDPRETTAQQLDAWHLNKKDAPIAARAPLTYTTIDEDEEDVLLEPELRIVFLIDPEDSTCADLQIKFGLYTATAPVKIEVE